ncbi:unnamed protein product [Adineta ricciae]|uniref:Uncharacterized protein n=1 Tax=Adineta ricciae TaxID=249248 RepID=A0A813PGL0_ADIRI|nr:unnamed protein product [Adineta ricciae]
MYIWSVRATSLTSQVSFSFTFTFILLDFDTPNVHIHAMYIHFAGQYTQFFAFKLYSCSNDCDIFERYRR